MLLDFEDKSNALMWAVGKTGRTSFVWTLSAPGTKFCHKGCSVFPDVHYLSLFKWSYPLWSSLDIAINEDLIDFLREGHSRIEYNQYFQGEDFDGDQYMLEYRHSAAESPLPQGNHVIAIFQAAGILVEQMPSRCFLLKTTFIRNEKYQIIDQVLRRLQGYFDSVKITREEIEQNPEYLKKIKQMNSRYDKDL